MDQRLKGHSAYCIVVIALVDHVLLFSSGENVGFQDCDNEMQNVKKELEFRQNCQHRQIKSQSRTLTNQIYLKSKQKTT